MDPGAIACVVWLARSPQGQASVCARHTHWCVRCRVRTRRHTGCVRVPSGSHAGMCRLGPAPPWHSPPRPPLTPLPRVPQGRVGPGRPGNLWQLLCSVSGKPPAASVLPAEPTCLCTCPLGFQEGWGGGGRPCPQPCMPESTAQTHLVEGVCNPLSLEPPEPLTAGTSRRDSSRGGSLSRRGN